MATIKELADSGQFIGSRFHKHADFVTGKQFTVDETAYGPTVNTSIDCYVTGIYMGPKGQSISIKQRYTVFVSYTKNTQLSAMNKIRAQIIQDFEMNFPQFKVSDIFIPETSLPIPPSPSDVGDDMDTFYRGSELFKRISSVDVGQFRVETEKAIFNSRVKQIKRKYGLR